VGNSPKISDQLRERTLLTLVKATPKGQEAEKLMQEAADKRRERRKLYDLAAAAAAAKVRRSQIWMVRVKHGVHSPPIAPCVPSTVTPHHRSPPTTTTSIHKPPTTLPAPYTPI